jgi:hypothetical protein
MKSALALLLLLPSLGWAIRTPSRDEIESLRSNTSNAYAQKTILTEIEGKLQAMAGSKDPGWENLLPRAKFKELSAARMRAGSAWSTLMEETIVAYGLLPIDPSPVGGSGIPRYPNEVIQGGDFTGTRRTWQVVYKQPEEGSIKGEDGKPLLGQAFKTFLTRYSGMTSPDGTTIVWGEKFKEDPYRFAQVLRHELAHYELLTDKDWAEGKTDAEREVESHSRSKAALKQFGLDPKTLTDAENLEDGNIAFYSAQVSTGKGASERRTWVDQLRELLRLKPRPEDPGYKVTDGFFMDPEEWAKIRAGGESLRFRTDAQRSERAVLRVAQDICANPGSASTVDVRQRFAAIPAYDAAATLAVPDACESAVHGLLWNAKARGQNTYFPPTVASVAESNRPQIVQLSATIVDFRLSEMAKRICAFPPAAWDRANAKEFRTLPRLDISEPRPRDPHSCPAKVHRRLWLWLTSGRSELDPGELSRITDEPSHVATPAILPQSPRPAPPPPAPPPPLPPEDLEPRPRETPAESFPPCLHDRCARRL